MLVAGGGIARDGQLGVWHRADVGLRPGDVEDVRRGGGGGRCGAGDLEAEKSDRASWTCKGLIRDSPPPHSPPPDP